MKLGMHLLLIALLPTAALAGPTTRVEVEVMDFRSPGWPSGESLTDFETCQLTERKGFYEEAQALSKKHFGGENYYYNSDRPKSATCENGMVVTIDRGWLHKPEERVVRASSEGLYLDLPKRGKTTVTFPQTITTGGHMASVIQATVEIKTTGVEHPVIQPKYVKHTKVILESEDPNFDVRITYICNAIWMSDTVGFLPHNSCTRIDPRGYISPPQFDFERHPKPPVDKVTDEEGPLVFEFHFMEFGLHGCRDSNHGKKCQYIIRYYEAGDVVRSYYEAPPEEATIWKR